MCENSKRIGFFGLGKSNISLMGLEDFKNCSLTLRSDVRIDKNLLPQGLNIERIFEGESSTCDIDEDLLIFSPSVRRDREEFLLASKNAVIFSSDAEIFFERNRKPVFSITGSDGKSTTATILHLLLSEGGQNNKLIGNIGEAMCSHLESADSYVCELSSFMLSYVTPMSRRACITNITPNHLDWHRSFDEYKATKLSLLGKAKECVLTDEFEEAYAIVSIKKSINELKKTHRCEFFVTLEDENICRNGVPILKISDIHRKENHNILNFMMALAMADGYTDEQSIKRVAKDFRGLAHRCELVMSEKGVDYYNSSIDSSPTRTINTLKSLGRQVVLILGGKSKGLDYSVLLPSVKKYAPRVIITGENAWEIYHSLKETNPEVIEGFEDAVLRGKSLAQSVGALLLSPASTSYDRFKNYEERGILFKEILLKSK